MQIININLTSNQPNSDQHFNCWSLLGNNEYSYPGQKLRIWKQPRNNLSY